MSSASESQKTQQPKPEYISPYIVTFKGSCHHSASEPVIEINCAILCFCSVELSVVFELYQMNIWALLQIKYFRCLSNSQKPQKMYVKMKQSFPSSIPKEHDREYEKNTFVTTSAVHEFLYSYESSQIKSPPKNKFHLTRVVNKTLKKKLFHAAPAGDLSPEISWYIRSLVFG